jgi:hypothetical protein
MLQGMIGMKLGKVRALERGDQQNQSQIKRHLVMLTQWLGKSRRVSEGPTDGKTDRTTRTQKQQNRRS